MSTTCRLTRLTPQQVGTLDRQAVEPQTLAAAAEIVEEVRRDGETALRRLGERFGELSGDQALVLTRDQLEADLAGIEADQRGVLERTARRIADFAEAQLGALAEIEVPVPGGLAGHTVSPVARAGCYAPGGRYPLPSSVLMTAVTARVAGVPEVVVASPRPTKLTRAAAAVAGADCLLRLGGAHAIAALAFGVGLHGPCHVIVGPGNRWVTAAKQLVAGRVGIDMLAGPSELVVLADASADPQLVAADLLAQAEHDPDALPILVTTDASLVDRVEVQLEQQLDTLPTREIAVEALANGFAVVADDLATALQLCDRLAPEHLQVLTSDAAAVAKQLTSYGALFVGPASAEVLGDYGAGPNHTLPTGGSARYTGGLSVFDFVRVRTKLHIHCLTEAEQFVTDVINLAHWEGLEAHARAAGMRLPGRDTRS